MQVRVMSDAEGRRGWALALERGEEVLEALEAFVRDREVTGAHLHGLGAFRDATLAFFDPGTKEYVEIPVEEQVEVAALHGDVGRDGEGEVVVHIHCVLGRRDGSTVAGHLLRGVARPTLELFLQEAGGTLTRRPDEASGLDLFDFGGS